jgi:hypothetical protein
MNDTQPFSKYLLIGADGRQRFRRMTDAEKLAMLRAVVAAQTVDECCCWPVAN